jgi:hypothetical protein
MRASAFFLGGLVVGEGAVCPFLLSSAVRVVVLPLRTGAMVAPLAQRVHRELGVTQWPVPDGIKGSCTKDSGTEDLIGVVGEGP